MGVIGRLVSALSAGPAGPRYRSVVHVYAILRDGERVLMTRRAPGITAGGYWQLPGGHLDEGESVADAVARETTEEVGVMALPEEFRFRYLMHYRNRAGAGRVTVFFELPNWVGTPENREPERCTGLGFFAVDDLPAQTLPHVRKALLEYRSGFSFGVQGWAR